MLSTASIHDKIETLNAVQHRYEVHGADAHRFRMDPTVTLQTIERWEQEHAVKLPLEYREFLLRVGNGPCGPGYGLSSFPPDNEFAGCDCLIDSPVSSFAAVNANNYDQSVKDNRGFIRLSDYGCAMRAILVLNGKFAGHVWLDGAGTGDLSPFPPIMHNLARDPDNEVAPYNFLEWYDDWLNCAIDGTAIP